MKDCSYAALINIVDTLDFSTVRQYYGDLCKKPRSTRLNRLIASLEARLSPTHENLHGMEHQVAPVISLARKTLWSETVFEMLRPVICESDQEQLVGIREKEVEYEVWSMESTTKLGEILLRYVELISLNRRSHHHFAVLSGMVPPRSMQKSLKSLPPYRVPPGTLETTSVNMRAGVPSIPC